MNDLRQLLEDPEVSFAIVGATDTPGKYGGRIYRDLKGKGYKVFAVNPRAETVDGDPAYPTLKDLPEKPTMAVLVVPAPVGMRVVDDATEIGLENIWVQPGAESEELMAKLDEKGISWIGNGPCVMVETRRIA
ncbi:MAG TPA: CoA-binding protein [Acidimicrobiia bacterium]